VRYIGDGDSASRRRSVISLTSVPVWMDAPAQPARTGSHRTRSACGARLLSWEHSRRVPLDVSCIIDHSSASRPTQPADRPFHPLFPPPSFAEQVRLNPLRRAALARHGQSEVFIRPMRGTAALARARDEAMLQ